MACYPDVKKCVYLTKSLVPAPHQDIKGQHPLKPAAHPCSRHFIPLIFQSCMWAPLLPNSRASHMLPLFLRNSLCVLQRTDSNPSYTTFQPPRHSHFLLGNLPGPSENLVGFPPCVPVTPWLSRSPQLL